MKTAYVQIRVSEHLKENFKKAAESKGMDISEYIRYLMQKETEKHS